MRENEWENKSEPWTTRSIHEPTTFTFERITYTHTHRHDRGPPQHSDWWSGRSTVAQPANQPLLIKSRCQGRKGIVYWLLLCACAYASALLATRRKQYSHGDVWRIKMIMRCLNQGACMGRCEQYMFFRPIISLWVLWSPTHVSNDDYGYCWLHVRRIRRTSRWRVERERKARRLEGIMRISSVVFLFWFSMFVLILKTGVLIGILLPTVVCSEEGNEESRWKLKAGSVIGKAERKERQTIWQMEPKP